MRRAINIMSYYAWTHVLICLLAMINPVFATPSNKLFLGANWKCSLETPQEVDALVQELNRLWTSLSGNEQAAVELCVHPPYCFVDRVRARLNKDISVGSQNVFDCRGPNIGNTAAVTTRMLQNIGCDWVLLGHSDRRNNLGETDSLIASKVRQSLDAGLNVVLTIGELQSQRRWGLAVYTLRKQLRAAAKVIKSDEWHRIVVAYEPVWAVGEGATPCSAPEAQRIHTALRRCIEQAAGQDAASQCRLVYTGSVTADNAEAYAEQNQVDGFVVGRAGLDMTQLRSIIATLAKKD